MEEEAETRRKVDKCMKFLSRKEKVDYALKRLASLSITLEILSETGVGKAVNQFRDDPHYGAEARRIVDCWKELARSHGLSQRSDIKSPEHAKNGSNSPKKDKKAKKHKFKEEDSTNRVKAEVYSNEEVGSSRSGISFADMLASADNVKPPKNKKLKIDWKSSPVDVNYAPSRRLNLEPTFSVKQPATSKSSSLDSAMFRPRKDARKIFAGRPKGDHCRVVPSLIDICVRVLIGHIDEIEETGDIPFELLKPVLEKCTPEQLRNIEGINPYLMEDSDELWERIVSRCFPSGAKDKGETWRDCYQRLCEEKEMKLRSISSRITQHNREIAVPVKKAILAEAKAPREVRRRQIRHGTGHVQRELPSASELSKARKAIFDRGNKDALQNLPQAVRNTTSMLGAHADKKKNVAKKGALMVKTLKMLKCKNRK